MANRAFRRDMATLDNELIFVPGVIHVSGTTDADPTKTTVTHTLTGTLGTGSIGVQHNASGSFLIVMKDVYPRKQFFGATVASYTGLNDLFVVEDLYTTKMGALAYASGSNATNGEGGTSQVGFKIINGSSVYEPTGSIDVNVLLVLKNSSV